MGNVDGEMIFVDHNNLKFIKGSLVPKFMRFVCVRGTVYRLSEKLLTAAWTLERIIIENTQLAADCSFPNLVGASVVVPAGTSCI